MILIYAILFILFEAVGEALIKQSHPGSFIFKWWIQWIIAIGLFAGWCFIAYLRGQLSWDTAIAFVLVRYFLFDIVYNLTSKQNIFYVGNTKLYDKILRWIGFIPMVATKMFSGFIGIIYLATI